MKKTKSGKPRLARSDKDLSVQISATLPFALAEKVKDYAYKNHLTFSGALATLLAAK